MPSDISFLICNLLRKTSKIKFSSIFISLLFAYSFISKSIFSTPRTHMLKALNARIFILIIYDYDFSAGP